MTAGRQGGTSYVFEKPFPDARSIGPLSDGQHQPFVHDDDPVRPIERSRIVTDWSRYWCGYIAYSVPSPEGDSPATGAVVYVKDAVTELPESCGATRVSVTSANACDANVASSVRTSASDGSS